MICALVLAGGRSRRLGSEKAIALFKGEPLLARTVRRLAEQQFPIAVNAPIGSGASSWADEHARQLIGDDAGDPPGPLAGVKAGLRWAEQQGAALLVTTPCDTPFLPDDLETALAAALTPPANAAVARSPSGLQSLCAIWRVAPALVALEAHFAAGRHPPVHDLLAQLGAVEVDFPDDVPFANLNTRDDIVRAEGA